MKLLHYRGAVPNFGDDLNADLWPALAPGLFDEDASVRFAGIGTIIGMDCDPSAKLHVFSSGVGNDPVERWLDRDVTYWCVRGPLSCRVLNLPPTVALTDGAILTPFASGFPRAASGGKAVLIIPHFQSMQDPGWDTVAEQTGFELLDPRADAQSVIAKIASARLVLTESLHGAILADTYGIPWSVFATSRNFGSTKFLDWCLSLELDFSLTYVPPPNAGHILRHGKGPCQWGQTVRPSADDAVAAFHTRIAPAAGQGWRGRLKAEINKREILKRILPYSPDRTAAALTRLAAGPVQLSSHSLRQSLQDRMMGRLQEVEFFFEKKNQKTFVI